MCPKCKRTNNKKFSVLNLIPEVNFLKCYNCRKKYIWILFMNTNIIINEKSLLE